MSGTTTRTSTRSRTASRTAPSSPYVTPNRRGAAGRGGAATPGRTPRGTPGRGVSTPGRNRGTAGRGAAGPAGGGGGAGPPGGGGGGPPPGGGGAGPPGGQAPIFSLTPGVQDINFIDYGTKAGKKIFEEATKAVKDEFDGTSEKVTILQEQMEGKCTDFGWNNQDTSDIINIPPDLLNPGDTVNLLQEYSQLSMAMITTWAMAFIVNRNTRRAQNNYNMYRSLVNSLDSDTQTIMALEKDKYTVQGQVITALFYKILISKAEVDTQATIALTRTALTKLDQKMLDLNSNVKDFNTYVKTCKSKLNNRRADSSDLLINLFTGYKAARDSDFVDTIQQVEKDYLHGKTPNLTDEQLMSQALVAYQVRKEAGIWGNLSQEQELIVAMQAELSGIKDKRLKLDTKSNKTKGKGKGKGKKKQGERTRSEYQRLNPWKYKNTNNATTKVHDSKTYYWCKYHNNGDGMWVEHQLSECRNRERDEANSPGTDPTSAETQAHAAIAAIQEESEEEDSDSE